MKRHTQGEQSSDSGSESSNKAVPKRAKRPLCRYYCNGPVSEWQPSDDGNEEIVRYDSEKLISVRTFLVVTRGTIFKSPVLAVETALVMLTFGLAACTMFLLHKTGYIQYYEIRSQKDAIWDYLSSITNVVTFVLGTYTTVVYARWWRLRTAGVGAIWTAGANIAMNVCAHVTHDADVISAIDRYTRASIMLVFMSQRGLKSNIELLEQRDILTQGELDQLSAIKGNNHQCVAIWTWTAALVQGLRDRGLVDSEVLHQVLMEQVQAGRSHAQLIMNQMACPLPMSYVAIIGLVVKIHNYSYAAILGCLALAGANTEQKKEATGKTTGFIEILRIFIVSTIFNGLLSITQGMMNPFDGTLPDCDFPMTRINASCRENMAEYLQMARSLPSWMQDAGLAGASRQASLHPGPAD